MPRSKTTRCHPRGAVRPRTGRLWIRLGRRAAIPVAALLGLLLSTASAAQPDSSDRVPLRPGSERPALPEWREEPQRRLPILPPLDDLPEGPAAQLEVQVEQIQFLGNSVISDAELATLAAAYEGRRLLFVELQALRDEAAGLYRARGYATSGVRIPDQEVRNGIVELEVIEGRLADVEFEGLRYFRPLFMRARLVRAAGEVVNVNDLERELQLLERDERIDSVDARLDPGAVTGESILRVRVQENERYDLFLSASNHRSPTIGPYGIDVGLGIDNPIGFGERTALFYTRTEGLNEVSANLTFPITSRGTALRLYLLRSWAEVVEDQFASLDIESNAETYGIGIDQIVFQDLRDTVELSVVGEWRRSESFFSGEPFSFAPGVEDGVSKIAVLRSALEWVHRDSDQVLAARSTVSWGLHALGATRHIGGDLPDGRFVSWLGQIQIARRLPWFESLIIVRADAQLTNSSLLGLEQFSVGGHASVRGYRENQLVRDQGVVTSTELRVPALRAKTGEPVVVASAFVDFGYAWNEDLPTVGRRAIVAPGLGLRWTPRRQIDVRIDWAEALRDPEDGADWDLQDTSFHISVDIHFP